MVLSQERVAEIINSGVQPKMELARKNARKLNMHVTGFRTLEFLHRLDDYETNAQELLRKKLLKTNASLFSNLIRPTDKVFTAKGGSINYNVSKDKIDKIRKGISDIADGLDIKKYLSKVVKKQFIIDPNAILFVDIDNDGLLETHLINSDKILWIENKGNNVKAIVFEGYKKELSESEERTFSEYGSDFLQRMQSRKYYRVIDKYTDSIYIKDGDEVYLEESSQLDNFFGFVPAKIIGDDKSPNFDIFVSLFQDIVDDADEFLRDMSVKTIHKLAHAYPLYYALEQACTRCGGEGTIKYNAKNEDGEDEIQETVCISCGGTGEKTRLNPSDKMILKAPQEGQPLLSKDNIAGTISPNLETARFYEDIIKEQRQVMFQAVWGTTYEQGGKRETATGRWIDAAPVRDRLRDISDTFAKLHQFLLDCYGKVILHNPNYYSHVSYGDRYILESPDDLLKKYQEATNYKVSQLVILDLRDQYFESEYQNDTLELMKFKKLASIEPFPTLTISDIKDLEWVSEDDKLRKVYYSTWVSTLTNEEIVLLKEQELKNKFEEYIIKLKTTI